MLVCLTALVCNPFLTTGFDKVGKPQQLLLRLPQLYSPARSRSSARSTLEKVVIDHVTVYACNCSVNPFTIVAAKPLSVVFPFLAVYTSNADTYSLLASALTQTFIPRFMGMYSFRLDFPLNCIIVSSMMFLPSFQTSANRFLRNVIVCAIFSTLLYPSVCGGDSVLLSTKCKYQGIT